MEKDIRDFPEVVDSSLISAFRACPQKASLEYFQHYKPIEPSIHLPAGGAFARGVEVTRREFWEKEVEPDEALLKGMKALQEAYGQRETATSKSLDRMLGALEFYFSRFPLREDKAIPHRLPSGSRAIEFSFVEPLPINHPQTGQPILFAGRFDLIADFLGGLWGVDEKTTTSLGAGWSGKWDLRSQFTSYVWGAAAHNLHLQGFVVRGVSILKERYETAEAITYRPQWAVDRWLQQTVRDVQRMVEMWKAGEWEFNLDESCNAYGGCMFRQVCLSNDPAPWLSTNFRRRRWDPVTRTEEGLE